MRRSTHPLFGIISIAALMACTAPALAAGLSDLLGGKLESAQKKAPPAAAGGVAKPAPAKTLPAAPTRDVGSAIKAQLPGVGNERKAGEALDPGVKSLLGAKDGEIGSLTSKLGDTNKLLDSVTAENGSLKSLLSAKDSEIGSLTGKLGDTSKLLNAVTAENGGLKGLLSAKDGEIGSLTSKLGNTSELLDAVTTENGSLKGLLSAKDGKIGSLADQLGGMGRIVDSLKGENSQLKNLLGGKEGEIGSLTGKLGNLGGLLDSVQAENGSLKSLLGSKEGEIGSLTGKLGDTSKLLDSMTAENGGLKTLLGSKDSEIGSLQGKLDAQSARTASLAQNLKTVDTARMAAEEALEASKNRAAELEQTGAKAASKSASELGALQARFDTLTGEYEVGTARIAKLETHRKLLALVAVIAVIAAAFGFRRRRMAAT